MQKDGKRAAERAKVARGRIGRLTVALREAQARGEVVTACEPEAMAHFLVASLEGATLISRLTRDLTVMERCMSELDRYLALYEVRVPSASIWAGPARRSSGGRVRRGP